MPLMMMMMTMMMRMVTMLAKSRDKILCCVSREIFTEQVRGTWVSLQLKGSSCLRTDLSDISRETTQTGCVSRGFISLIVITSSSSGISEPVCLSVCVLYSVRSTLICLDPRQSPCDGLSDTERKNNNQWQLR